MEIISKNVFKQYKIKKSKSTHSYTLGAVNNLNYKITQGEIIALLGLTNSGKSTIIKLLSGAEKPTQGTILVDGAINYKKLKESSKILDNFNKRKLLIKHTVFNNLIYFGKKEKMSENDIEKTIADLRPVLELDKIINQKISALTPLDLIKVNIAITMLTFPSILYFDEALTNIDMIEKNILLKLLKRINKEFKTSIVIASSSIVDAEKICKRISILKNGTIVADDKKEIICDKFFNHKNLTIVFNKSYTIPKGEFEILESNDYFLKIKIDFNKCDFATFINQFDINTIIDINISPFELEAL